MSGGGTARIQRHRMASEEKQDSETSLDDIGLKYAYAFGKGKLYTGGDKTSLGHGFTTHYDSLLHHLRLQPVQLLELGVCHGKSLAMWSEYFAQGTIHGVDIDLKHFHANESELKKRGLDTSKIRVCVQGVALWCVLCTSWHRVVVVFFFFFFARPT